MYRAQGRYAEAEPLQIRAMVIFEKAFGPEHPDVAIALENYAALLRARAKAIRARHAKENM